MGHVESGRVACFCWASLSVQLTAPDCSCSEVVSWPMLAWQLWRLPCAWSRLDHCLPNAKGASCGRLLDHLCLPDICKALPAAQPSPGVWPPSLLPPSLLPCAQCKQDKCFLAQRARCSRPTHPSPPCPCRAPTAASPLLVAWPPWLLPCAWSRLASMWLLGMTSMVAPRACWPRWPQGWASPSAMWTPPTSREWLP